VRILVADTDRMSMKLTTFLLESSGYSVSTATKGGEILQAIEQQDFDLILLDVELPDMTGFEVCRKVRRTSNIPLFFLSGCTNIEDRVQGLQLGADDYLTKPYEPLELLARIEAILRRRDSDTVIPLARLRQGDLTLEPFEHRAQFADGHYADLTPVECRLLYYMMKNAGQVLSPDQILDKVWQGENGGANLVAVYVRRLRLKIERDTRHPRYITTLPNLGYKFEVQKSTMALV
jgi:DNA-binding response OmpR family regulator